MAGSPFYTALIDSNVLHSMVMTDVIMRFHHAQFCSVRWSKTILSETKRSILRAKPYIEENKINYRFSQMAITAPDALVTGYEELALQVNLWPDQDDKHVLAAAIVGHCDTIVICNTKHFLPEYLNKYKISATTPDDFILDQVELHPGASLQIFKTMRADRNRHNSINQFILDFQKAGLDGTVKFLEEFKEHI